MHAEWTLLLPDRVREILRNLAIRVEISHLTCHQLCAKYFSVIVDSTPDLAHVDQLTFVFRFVSADGGVVERQRAPQNPLIHTPCGAHSLNLVGVNCVDNCCEEVNSFFLTVAVSV